MPHCYFPVKKIFGLLVFLCWCSLLTAQPPTISYERVVGIGPLSAPVDIVNAGDGTNRLFIVQQAGIIQVWNGATLSQFANLGAGGANLVNTSGGERGLLSMAFHPNYDGVTNRYFFVYYTDATGNIEVRRFQTTLGNINTADLGTGVSIINITRDPANGNHNGGKLNFGRDGYLYFAPGDGGGGNDIPNNAQTGTVLLGKMIRLDINTPSAMYGNYSVPATNPYVGNPSVDERIWALGLRNPFRWSFDRLSDDMWIGDVGQGAQEEINFRPRALSGHVNYGWRCFEGYPSTPGVTDCNPVDYVPPVYDYPNPASGASAVTGGYVYRGNEYPNMRGYYISADVYSGEIHMLWPNGSGGFDSATQAGPLSFVVGFGEAEDGTLFLVSQQTDSVYKVVGTGGVVLPAKLSAFNAAKKTGYNQLKWTTVSEINTARFYVTYSNDGSHFQTVGTVQATRNTNGSDYHFDHYLTSNRDMYYRLAMEDDNGTVKYSSILRLQGTTQQPIRIYPTVVQNNVFTLEVPGTVNLLRIYNSNGALVFKKDLESISGSMSIYLPYNLSRGVYLAEILGDRVSEKKKIILQ